MTSAHTEAPNQFPRPPGLVEVVVCAESGQLPSPACAHRKKELFLAENVPVDVCQMHRLVTLDAATGEVASRDCPPERLIVRRVTYWPAEALPWAEEEGLPLPPMAAEVGGATARLTDAVEDSGLYLASPFPNTDYLIAPDLPLAFQRIEVAVVCAPELGLSDLSLWVDGQRWHTWQGPPYQLFWTLSPGPHAFRVEGLNSRLQTVSSPSVHIRVEEPSANSGG